MVLIWTFYSVACELYFISFSMKLSLQLVNYGLNISVCGVFLINAM
jgi:hypothetical protein